MIYVLDVALPPTSPPISLFSVSLSKLALISWITFMAGCYSHWPNHLGTERTGIEHEKKGSTEMLLAQQRQEVEVVNVDVLEWCKGTGRG